MGSAGPCSGSCFGSPAGKTLPVCGEALPPSGDRLNCRKRVCTRIQTRPGEPVRGSGAGAADGFSRGASGFLPLSKNPPGKGGFSLSRSLPGGAVHHGLLQGILSACFSPLPLQGRSGRLSCPGRAAGSGFRAGGGASPCPQAVQDPGGRFRPEPGPADFDRSAVKRNRYGGDDPGIAAE